MSEFPNPEGKINVLKRYLHVLALLQYIPDGENPETWNAKKIAKMIELEEHGREIESEISDNHVSKYINKNIIEELGIDVSKTKGGLFTTLEEDLDIETQLKIAKVYADFVIKDTTRDTILKKFIEAMPDRALWTLARIYFAVIERRMIQFNYVTNTGYKITKWKLVPYYFIIRSNNLYLVVWDPAQKKNIPLIADRISNLIVLDEKIPGDFNIKPVEELFKDALGAFISEGKPVEMKIRYSKKQKSTIESIVSPLDPQIKSVENDDWFESVFSITDYLYLCKQFVLYGSDVEIISPPLVRQAMIDMLKKSLGVYEKIEA